MQKINKPHIDFYYLSDSHKFIIKHSATSIISGFYATKFSFIFHPDYDFIVMFVRSALTIIFIIYLCRINKGDI